MNKPVEPLDLSICDREPIHIPGAVQPHGVLFALRDPDLTVSQVSASLAPLLGLSPAEVLERPVSELLDAGSFATLQAALSGSFD
ncbi:MAG TPA: hypothetical protein VEB20_08385, partial [Azospirillaceae bacterium]|nr:hypothetical protein [Azospirillaceae bacterium]